MSNRKRAANVTNIRPGRSPGALGPLRPSPKESSRLVSIAGIAAVALAIPFGAVLRVWASLDNFWLDEIWSWQMARQLNSPLEVITRVHHDNNHYLNTYVIYLFGPDAPTWLYRMPAVIAGIGTVLLCGLVARRWSKVAAVTATLLTACSFLLIQYSSEARGYAYLLFFMMASFAVIQQSLEHPRAVWEILFACFAVLGYLSHLTFFFAHVALVAWSFWHQTSRYGWLTRRQLTPFIFEVLIPAGFVAYLYFADLRFLVLGGGTVSSAGSIIAQATSAAFGGPLEGWATVLVTFVVTLIAAAALFLLYRTGSDLWVPFLTGIVLVPAAVLLLARPAWPYPRYFLVSILFLQLLVSWFLGWIFHRPYGKFSYLLIMAAILGGNAFLTARFLKYGRGGYEAAVRYLLEQSPAEQVVVGSDHDFRNKTMLGFYLMRIGDTGRVVYVEINQWPPEGPEWLVVHNFAQEFVPGKLIGDKQGNTYKLARVFAYAGLSGFNWALYRNSNRVPAAAFQHQSPPD